MARAAGADRLAAAALALLGLALSMQKRLTSNPARFGAFRTAFLATTLAGIGWWGQGQLSINNVLSVINAARTSGDFGYLLFDPVSLLLWVFVLATLVLFGRGTFCGWLCPFGALQEFVGQFRALARVAADHRSLCRRSQIAAAEYVLLAAIVVSAFAYTPAAEWLAESSPSRRPSRSASTGLAVRALRRGRAAVQRLCLQGLLSLSLSARRMPRLARAVALVSIGSPGARNAARPASCAPCAAATARSNRRAPCVTTNASNAWIAS